MNRKGTALITVLGLVSLICIASGYIAYMASQEMHMGRVIRESSKAKYIAESGLNTAYILIKYKFSRADGLHIEGTFADGKYVVTGEQDPENDQRFKLTSLGTCGVYGRFKVAADVENRPVLLTGNSERFFALPYDFLGLSAISLSGNLGAGVTSIHGNGPVTMTGASSTDATTITSAMTVTLKKVSPAPITQSGTARVAMPANLTAAINELILYATENGEVYRSGEMPSATPIGGVAVVTGLPPANWTGGTGCYIFTGGGRAVLNGITINNVAGYPSLIFPNSTELAFTGNVILNGAVLLPSSSLRIAGNAAVYGPLIVGMSVEGSGTANLFTGDFGQGFNLPPSSTDNVVISAWH